MAGEYLDKEVRLQLSPELHFKAGEKVRLTECTDLEKGTVQKLTWLQRSLSAHPSVFSASHSILVSSSSIYPSVTEEDGSAPIGTMVPSRDYRRFSSSNPPPHLWEASDRPWLGLMSIFEPIATFHYHTHHCGDTASGLTALSNLLSGAKGQVFKGRAVCSFFCVCVFLRFYYLRE